jgi:hypothetical protein
MAEVLFDRAFSRQVGGVPPPPAVGTDVLPANVAGSNLLDNGLLVPARTYDYSVSAVVLSVTTPIPTQVAAEVYIGDEARNTWFLLGQANLVSNQITRMPILSGPGTTGIYVYVRPIPQALPPGNYQFFFGADQAARPLPDGTTVTVNGTVTIGGGSLTIAGVSGVMPSTALADDPARAGSRIVKATGGTFWQAYANNSSNADIWLFTFDAFAVPANGTPPLDFVQVPRKNNGEAAIVVPRVMRNGIVWAASTTPDTLTLAGAVLLTRTRYE